FLLLELFLELDLRLLDAVDQGLELDDGFGAAPHEDPVDVPVAPVEGAVLEEVNRFAEYECAVDEAAVEERLAADIDGLVPERHFFVLGQKHGGNYHRWAGECL